VYLADNNAKWEIEFYALRTACNKGGECLIVTTEPNPENLYPDDNLYRNSQWYDKNDLIEMQKKVIENKDDWKESLEKIKKISHRGEIKPNHLLDFKVQSKQDNIWFGFIKHMEHTIDVFDNSWKIYNELIKNKWFDDLQNKNLSGDEDHERIMRSFAIRKNRFDEGQYFVECLGKNVTVIV
jgi:hypothetical protein